MLLSSDADLNMSSFVAALNTRTSLEYATTTLPASGATEICASPHMPRYSSANMYVTVLNLRSST